MLRGREGFLAAGFFDARRSLRMMFCPWRLCRRVKAQDDGFFEEWLTPRPNLGALGWRVVAEPVARSATATFGASADVMEHYSASGVESTRRRKATAFRSRPFALLRGITLMDTEAGHLLAVLQHERAGNREPPQESVLKPNRPLKAKLGGGWEAKRARNTP
jgi:hypothetical protein